MKRWLVPIQFILQGAFIALLSIGWGMNYFSWLGILLILIGLILALSSLGAPPASSPSLPIVLPPSPSAPPPSEREAKDSSSSGAEGFSPPPGGGTAREAGRGEDEAGKREEEAPPPPPVSSSPLLFDADTNAYSLAYAKARTNDEIARIKRYKRWAVFLMVSFDFSPPGTVMLSEENKRKSFFRSYCAFLKSTLRTCDAVCRASETALFAILPETLSGEPIYGVLKKISDFKTPLGDLVKGLSGEVKMQASHIFFNVSSPDMSFDNVISNLYSSLTDYEC